MHILVTAGPTHEYLDAVRYLGNPSSGRIGFACAREAARRGHRVTLVTGPVGLPDPPGVRTVRVVSAREMRRAVLAAFPGAKAVIMAAAVSDYRPAKTLRAKMKKSRAGLCLRLVRNPDILEELGRRRRGQVLVGFALEVQGARANALAKARKKNLDYVVLNSPRTFGSGRIHAEVFRGGRKVKSFRGAKKEELARWLVGEIGRARR